MLFKLRLACLIFLCLVAGCGYQIGALKVGEHQKIAVHAFTNKTGLPGLETITTNAVIKQLKIDGTYEVVADRSSADVVIEGDLISYSRDALSFSSTDVTNEYRGTLAAKLVLKDAKTDKVIWTIPRVEGEALFPRAGDQAENERNAYPALTNDLSKYIVEKIIYGGW